jgi:hypothetical protein
VIIGFYDELGRALRAAIDVLATQRIVLAIAPHPFDIVIAFVAGDHHRHTGPARLPQRLEHVHRADDVGREGIHRIGIGSRHDRLGGEVEHEIGPCLENGTAHRVQIAHIDQAMVDPAIQPQLLEHRRRGGNVARQADHLGAELEQPCRQPAALEAGMPGDEHPLAVENIIEH